jgi:putative transposase
VRFAFIQGHRKEFDVGAMCNLLIVSRSGYYAWTKRRPGRRRVDSIELLIQIRVIYQQSRGTYGSPRVWRALRKAGIAVSRRRVESLMAQNGLRSKRTRRFRVKTTDANHPHPVAANTLDRAFEVGAINRVWVTDLTYVGTGEGWLYVATVMDLGSRRIIGWAAADHLRAELAIEALGQAIARRCPGPDLLHHSDRGVQYACEDYQAILERHGIACSMSRPGNCYDNAVAESFFKTFKVECVYQEDFATREEATASIYHYIEVFYNHQRLHSSLGYQSPVEYEASLA